jgi:ERF superfamily
MMNVYQRLNAARTAFHKLPLKKTGENKFAKYHYFELGDFLIPALGVFAEHGLCATVSFKADEATMTIRSVETPEDFILITSPMGSADLKGCHEVQNVGAVETYQRRYLWVAALEIVEHDALDSGQPKEERPAKGAVAAKSGAKSDPVQEVIAGVKSGDASGAAAYLAGLPQAKLDAIWSKLPVDIVDALSEAWPEVAA